MASPVATLALVACLGAPTLLGAVQSAGCDLTAAADQAAFLEHWRSRGGEVGLEDEISTLLRRAGRNEPGVVAELRAKYEGPSFYSMLFAAVGYAIDAGDTQAAEGLLSEVDRTVLDEDQNATLAAILIRLGKTGEGAALLADVEDGRNVASDAAGTILLHHVATLGLEDGLRRYREFAASPALGLYGASTHLDRLGQRDSRRELLSSPQIPELLGSDYSAASVIADIEEAVGEEAVRAAIAAVHVAMEQGDPHSRQFHLPALVEILAREGCSDACLEAAAGPIGIAAEADPAWNEEWTRALAATGDLQAALQRSGDAEVVLKAATEWAAGRGAPEYVLPLIFPLPPEERARQLASLVRMMLWAEAAPEALSRGIALAGPIEDPAAWSDVVGLVVHATYLDEGRRRAVREGLLRATTPSCGGAPAELPAEAPERPPADA